MSHTQNDRAIDALRDWLEENGTVQSDIQKDKFGYFVMVQSDNGNPGEDGFAVTEHRIGIPTKWWPLLKIK